MAELNLDMKSGKFVTICGLLGALAAVSMLIIMILSGFHGSHLLWIILAGGAAAIAYLVSIKTLTKFIAGLAFLAIPVGGTIVYWLLVSFGFSLLMNVFLFVTIVGLFGYFFVEKDDMINMVVMIASGLYSLCHLLPFSVGSRIPLQDIFGQSFIFALLRLLLFLGALAVFLVFVLEKLQAQLPVEPEFVLRICFFVLLGGVVLIFLLTIFNSDNFKLFLAALFGTLFEWSVGMMAGLSFFVIKEAQENRTLEVNFKL